jgi:hypothetical protein
MSSYPPPNGADMHDNFCGAPSCARNPRTATRKQIA